MARKRLALPPPTGTFDGLLMGAKEAAEYLGVSVGNLGQLVGLPAPVTRISAGNIWLAGDIRRFKDEREARPRRQLKIAA